MAREELTDVPGIAARIEEVRRHVVPREDRGHRRIAEFLLQRILQPLDDDWVHVLRATNAERCVRYRIPELVQRRRVRPAAGPLGAIDREQLAAARIEVRTPAGRAADCHHPSPTAGPAGCRCRPCTERSSARSLRGRRSPPSADVGTSRACRRPACAGRSDEKNRWSSICDSSALEVAVESHRVVVSLDDRLLLRRLFG